MLGKMNCNLCNSPDHVLVYKGSENISSLKPISSGYKISENYLEKPDKVVRCLGCGLIYAEDAPLKKITGDYSEMVDGDYLKEERGRRCQARQILSQIEKVKRGGKLLDIGCGPGFFLDEAKKRGWRVLGLDPSAWAADYAKKNFGIDVRKGFIEDANFPEAVFDGIMMNDVIEHLSDPKAALAKMRRWLKNDGILYISTPDIESFLSRLLRAKWWGINQYHLFYFSRKTLGELLGVVGFRKHSYIAAPRIFSLRYWSERLEGYPAYISAPFNIFSKFDKSGDFLLKINLFDQIGIMARKIHRLDTVDFETQYEAPAHSKKEKVTVVLPAYNAERTLERTVADIPKEIVSEIILVDDKSRDDTVRIAGKLGLVVYKHEKNTGYGGNQKTCYDKAIEQDAEIIVMVHPDYQYDPRIIPQLIEPIQSGRADAVFGSRMMKGGALEGGMPLWKHNANVLLTAFENVMLGTYLTEYHSGFRAYSAKLLKTIDYKANSNGFLFDTEIIVQILANRFKIEEIPIRTRYFEEASSIGFWPSVGYGLGIVKVMLAYFLYKKGILRYKALEPISSLLS